MDTNDINQLFSKGQLRNLIIIVGVLLLFFVLKPWAQVGAGQRGVVLNFGAVQDIVLEEGIHFRTPIMQDIVLIDVKIQKVVTDAKSSSSDLQDVDMAVALNYNIIPENANIVYQTIGTDYKSRIIDPAIQEVMKAVSARYTAEELITKRPVVSSEMREALKERLLEANISVVAFLLLTLVFLKPLLMQLRQSKPQSKMR